MVNRMRRHFERSRRIGKQPQASFLGSGQPIWSFLHDVFRISSLFRRQPQAWGLNPNFTFFSLHLSPFLDSSISFHINRGLKILKLISSSAKVLRIREKQRRIKSSQIQFYHYRQWTHVRFSIIHPHLEASKWRREGMYQAPLLLL